MRLEDVLERMQDVLERMRFHVCLYGLNVDGRRLLPYGLQKVRASIYIKTGCRFDFYD